MKHTRATAKVESAWSVFPELAPVNESPARWWRDGFRRAPLQLPPQKTPPPRITEPPAQKPSAPSANGHMKATTLSVLNSSQFGDLFVSFLRARKKIFIDRLQWNLPETDGMEFDQYDTPQARWIVIHEFGEVLAGIRLTPTTARCAAYSYMLRDAQNGLLENIPTDVLFFEAPVDPKIWEASRLFISEEVPAQRRTMVQSLLMKEMATAAVERGAMHVIGIVPAVWSRWLRRLGLNAVPVGPRFSIDGTTTQAALFNVSIYSD